MSALLPCCQAEEEEKCNRNRVAVTTREQLSTIGNGCKKSFMLSSDSSYSKLAKTEFIIEAYASAEKHRPQSVGRSNWDELGRETQKKINPKTGIFCFASSLAYILGNPYINQRYYRELQTIQIKLILLCVWAEPAVLCGTQTA